ncbi:MAG: exodeoxyribonuclease VII small subunit [Chloroflexota bacterium]
MTDRAASDAAQPMLDLPDEGFETLYARLEAVSQQLEAGGLTLEQSLALYEEGMSLAQRCQALLGAVEQRIETLRQGAGGNA